MKILLFSIVVMGLLTLTSCKTYQKDTKEIETVTFTKTEYQQWSAGIQGGGAGYNITLILENNNRFELDSIYFKNWKAKLFKNDGDGSYKAVINDGSNSEVLGPSGNSTTNSATALNTSYQLQGDEAVVHYYHDGRTKNQKITLDKALQYNQPRY